jgi:hypothetical protein
LSSFQVRKDPYEVAGLQIDRRGPGRSPDDELRAEDDVSAVGGIEATSIGSARGPTAASRRSAGWWMVVRSGMVKAVLGW